MAWRSIAVLLGAVLLSTCEARPKSNEESNDIPQFNLGPDGVSANFGGYRASAGLGGTLNGGPAGGLHAEAGIPGGPGAAAGLGGSVKEGGVLYSQANTGGGAGAGAAVGGGSSASSSSSAGGGGNNNVPQRGTKRPADFYDNIFNIPISVLQAVNQLLGGAPPPKHANVGAGASAHANANANAGAGIQTRTGASAGTHAQTGTTAAGASGDPKAGFFDSIFNIPISALKSVNQLLNNKNQQGQLVERRPVQSKPNNGRRRRHRQGAIIVTVENQYKPVEPAPVPVPSAQ